MNLLFPSPNLASPIDLVPKQSNVASVIACGGIWIGGKGWGLTWKLIQCVVKPQIMENVFGKCHIQLSEEDVESIEKKTEKKEEPPASYTEDSDEEFEPVTKVEAKAPVPKVEVPVPKVEVPVPKVEVPVPKVEVPVPEEVVEEEPEAEAEEVVAPKKKIVKKIVKKTV